MKKMLEYSLFFVFIPSVNPQFTAAHGTGYRILGDNKAVTAEFYYSDGEPMSYAGVLVFSPGDEKTEYQNGRTDRQGRFAFYPDKNGAWRIEANDGMGHKAQGSFEVREEKSDKTEAEKKIVVQNERTGSSSSLLLKSVAGISLIFNLYFGFYLLKRKHTS